MDLKSKLIKNLSKPLKNAIKESDNLNFNNACVEIDHFINKVDNKVGKGKITLLDGQALVDSANIIRQGSCFLPFS